MNKILLPAGLGLAAFAMSIMGASAAKGPAPMQLAASAVEIKAGEIITNEMIEAVSAPGGSSVGKSAIPFAERGVLLIGQVARKSVPKGEMLLFDDFRVEAVELVEASLGKGEAAVQVPLDNIKVAPGLIQLNAQIGFLMVHRTALGSDEPKKASQPRIIGPFRVVSVGGKANVLSRETKDQSSNPPTTVGIAVKPGPDGKLEGAAAELLQLIGAQPGQAGDAISAIVLCGSGK